MTEHALPATLLDDEGRLLIEVPCLSCGYVLKSLVLDARCPECGGLVSDSVVGTMLRFGSSYWLGAIASGANCLLISFAAVIGGAVLTLVVGVGLAIFADRLGLTDEIVAGLTTAAGILIAIAIVALLCLGFWRLTTPEPGNADPDRVRLWARFGLLVGLGLVVTFEVIDEAGLILPRIVVTGADLVGVLPRLVGVLLIAFGLAALSEHVRRLFSRIPRASLARQTTWVMVSLVPSYAVLLGGRDAMAIVDRVGIDIGGWVVVPVIGMVFAAVALVAFTGWAIVLLLVFRRVVNDARDASTALLPRPPKSRIIHISGHE